MWLFFSFFSYFSIGRTVGRTVVGCKNQRQHKIYVCIIYIYKTKSKANQNSLTTRCKSQFLSYIPTRISSHKIMNVLLYTYLIPSFSFSISYFSNAYCSIHHSLWNVWKNFIFGLLMSMVMVLTTTMMLLFYIYTDRVIEIYVMPNLYPVAYVVSNHYAVCQVQRSNSWPCAAFMRI